MTCPLNERTRARGSETNDRDDAEESAKMFQLMYANCRIMTKVLHKEREQG